MGSKGVIYMLHAQGKAYIGSTIDFDTRVAGHRSCCTNYENHDCAKVYKFFKTIGWDNIQIDILEKYPCKNEKELLCRERHWIVKLQPELNIMLPIAFTKEELLTHPDGCNCYFIS